MNINAQKRKLYLIYIKEYLRKLSILIGRSVYEDQLLSVDETKTLKNKPIFWTDKSRYKFSIGFENKDKKIFKKYIAKLDKENKSTIYIWINHVDECGLCVIHSLEEINWDFPYDIDQNGVIVFTDSNKKNMLLIDFYTDMNNKKLMEVEVAGLNWSRVRMALSD